MLRLKGTSLGKPPKSKSSVSSSLDSPLILWSAFSAGLSGLGLGFCCFAMYE